MLRYDFWYIVTPVTYGDRYEKSYVLPGKDEWRRNELIPAGSPLWIIATNLDRQRNRLSPGAELGEAYGDKPEGFPTVFFKILEIYPNQPRPINELDYWYLMGYWNGGSLPSLATYYPEAHEAFCVGLADRNA